MADPFRTQVRRCELCDSEVEADRLEPFAGFSACAGCRGGELDRAMSRHGLTCRTSEHRNEGTGSVSRFVEVLRPTILDVTARLDADTPRGWLRRKLGASDPEVGAAPFDERVKVAPADGSFTEPTLALLRGSAAARQAILELTGHGCEVDLVGRSIFVRSGEADLATIQPVAIALAIAVERFARQGPGSDSANEPCELCGSTRSGPLVSLAGIMACQRCQTWDPWSSPQSWGLQCSVSTEGPHQVITVGPLAVEAYVRFERESLVTRMTAHDYEVGDHGFDKKVSVVANAGYLGGNAELRALQDEGVRQGILELLELAGKGGSVEIFGRELHVQISARESAPGELGGEIKLMLMRTQALALGRALGRVRL